MFVVLCAVDVNCQRARITVGGGDRVCVSDSDSESCGSPRQTRRHFNRLYQKYIYYDTLPEVQCLIRISNVQGLFKYKMQPLFLNLNEL